MPEIPAFIISIASNVRIRIGCLALKKIGTKGPRENIILECTECKRRNYMTEKNKRNNTERLEVVKYCKFCKKRTTHKETK